jgi:NTP pyrophosphatase (non-canonical NTP hydrolase)
LANDSCIACAIEGTTAEQGSIEDSLHTCTKNPHISTNTTYTRYELAESDTAASTDYYTLNNYQQDTGTTAIYPRTGSGDERAVNYTILGLIGEAGEIANKWKKLLRDAPSRGFQPADYYEFYANLREDILNELGDVLWYVSQLSTELGVSLGDVADQNIRKLSARRDSGTLHGSGDDR